MPELTQEEIDRFRWRQQKIAERDDAQSFLELEPPETGQHATQRRVAGAMESIKENVDRIDDSLASIDSSLVRIADTLEVIATELINR